MKKLLLLFVAITALSISSCKKEDKQSVVGTWVYDSIINKETGEVLYQHQGRYLIRISENTYTMYYLSSDKNEIYGKQTGSYTIENNNINFDDWIDEGFKNGSFSFKDNNTLELSQEIEGTVYSLIIKRASAEESNRLDTLSIED